MHSYYLEQHPQGWNPLTIKTTKKPSRDPSPDPTQVPSRHEVKKCLDSNFWNACFLRLSRLCLSGPSRFAWHVFSTTLYLTHLNHQLSVECKKQEHKNGAVHVFQWKIGLEYLIYPLTSQRTSYITTKGGLSFKVSIIFNNSHSIVISVSRMTLEKCGKLLSFIQPLYLSRARLSRRAKMIIPCYLQVFLGEKFTTAIVTS